MNLLGALGLGTGTSWNASALALGIALVLVVIGGLAVAGHESVTDQTVNGAQAVSRRVEQSGGSAVRYVQAHHAARRAAKAKRVAELAAV